jgi:hypothetical protein
MAKPKKKPSKKPSRPAKSRTRRASPQPALSDDDVLALLKPPSDYEETIGELCRVWRLNKRWVRSGDMTPNRLESLLKKSLKAWAKESDLAAKQAARMRPLRDARLRAESATWDAALNVWDIVKAVSDDHPEVATAFEKVRTALTNARRKKTDAKTGT